ncbi:MAG: biotin/lipoyl-binding protein [Spirochaetia bacterium]|nr:biotin/lipoyl-binding protein [Spirochaetia bacterium]
MIKKFVTEGRAFTVEVQRQGTGFFTGLSEDGRADTNMAVESFQIKGTDAFHLRTAGAETSGVFHFTGSEYFVHIGGRNYRFQDAETADTGGDSSGLFKSPMPGKVTAVLVKEGDVVAVDQTLVVVEAMKMENAIKSDMAGKVVKVPAKPGELVSPDDVLVQIEAKE